MSPKPLSYVARVSGILGFVGFLGGCSASSGSGASQGKQQAFPIDSVPDATKADSAISFQRLVLANGVKGLVVTYSVPSGEPGRVAGDTVTYTVPASGVVHTNRRAPGPLVQTHLFRIDASGNLREILVAQNCVLHRVATRQYPGQTFGCWMPFVVLPSSLHPYIAAAVSDSAGLEAAYNSTMILMNHEAFGDRMHPVPTWTEGTLDHFVPNGNPPQLRSVIVSWRVRITQRQEKRALQSAFQLLSCRRFEPTVVRTEPSSAPGSCCF